MPKLQRTIEGERTQNIFTCPYCDTKLGAVNGQTGKPVIQVLGENEGEDYAAHGTPSLYLNFSPDSTMHNAAVKIKMENGSIK